MNRRELLEVVAAAGIATAGAAQAADITPAPAEHKHHDHAAMSKYADLVADTTRCVNTGEACVAHCLVLLGEGACDRRRAWARRGAHARVDEGGRVTLWHASGGARGSFRMS